MLLHRTRGRKDKNHEHTRDKHASLKKRNTQREQESQLLLFANQFAPTVGPQEKIDIQENLST